MSKEIVIQQRFIACFVWWWNPPAIDIPIFSFEQAVYFSSNWSPDKRQNALCIFVGNFT